MSDTPSTSQVKLDIDPRVVNKTIALKLRELANLFDQLGDGTVTRDVTDKAISAAQVNAARPPKADKKKEEKKTESKKEEKAEAAPAPPEKVAADLRLKLTTLVANNKSEAIRILGTYGAKKFSDIPVEKHAAALADIEKALAPKGEDDPLA